jgi:hypothetical protein
MLPILDLSLDYTLETIYGRNTASGAVKGFLSGMPESQADRAAKKHALALYTAKMPGNRSRFLDKTPRYYLIADRLEKLFRRSKHIYLVRNPLAILSSIYDSWISDDVGALLNYRVDLVDGIRLLADRVSSTKHLVIAYEHLLRAPDEVFSQLADYTGIEFPQVPLRYEVPNANLLGDNKQLIASGELSPANADAWQARLADPTFLALAGAYARSLDEKTFEQLGYSKSQTEAVLADAVEASDDAPAAFEVGGMNLDVFFSPEHGGGAKESWHALRKQIERLRMELAGERGELAKSRKHAQQLLSQNKAETKRGIELKASLDQVRTELAKAVDAGKESTAELQLIRQTQASSEKALVQAQEKLELATATVQSKDEEISGLKEEIQILKSGNRSLRNTLERRQHDLWTALAERETSELELRALRADSTRCHAALDACEEKLNARSLSLAQKEAENDQLLAEYANVSSEKHAVSLELYRAEVQISRLESAVAVYARLADSSWVKLGNGLYRPFKTLREFVRK